MSQALNEQTLAEKTLALKRVIENDLYGVSKPRIVWAKDRQMWCAFRNSPYFWNLCIGFGDTPKNAIFALEKAEEIKAKESCRYEDEYE